jgi:hypothetical protein
MRVAEKDKLIWAGEPKNYTGAAMTAKYVSLKNFGHLAIYILTGAWAAGTAAVTLSQATTVAGAGAKALNFVDYYDDKTTSGTLVLKAAVSNTFNLDTANKLFVIEIEPTTLDVAGGFDCVTLAVASPGANADFYGVMYHLAQARYGPQGVSAFTD